MKLDEQIRSDLKKAMMDRDSDRIRTLRLLLAAMSNAESVVVPNDADDPAIGAFASDSPRRQLSQDDLESIVRAELTEREVASDGYRNVGAEDRAEVVEGEIEILRSYLGRT